MFTTKDITFLGGKNGQRVSARSRSNSVAIGRYREDVKNYWLEKGQRGRDRQRIPDVMG